MTKRPRLERRPGFTLLETMVSCAIIALLLGLIYAGLSPAREKARQTTCISNLHQIGRAIDMYRQDYGGTEAPGSSTVEQLGLPIQPTHLLPYLGGNREVFLCSDEYLPRGVSTGPADRFGLRVSYMWCLAIGEDPPPGFPSFREQVALRGNDTPLVIDDFHQSNSYGQNSSRPWLHKAIILRLDGRVESHIYDKLEVKGSWAM